jgi:hypothetical protein
VRLSDFSADRLTVEGATVPVYVEMAEEVEPRIEVDLVVSYTDGNGRDRTVTRRRSSTVRRVPLRSLEQATGLVAYEVDWTADLEQDSELRERLVLVQFRMRGRSTATRALVSAWSPDHVGVVGIDITTLPALTRIMRHEFASPQAAQGGGKGEVFDPSAARAHLMSLSVQQRQLLVTRALRYPSGTLVVLITLYTPDRARRMHADFFDSSGAVVVPNASFTVFFCRDSPAVPASARSTSAVTLVCHTRNFVVNTVNSPTQRWISTRTYGGRKPNEWLAKTNGRPVRFLIAAVQPSHTFHHVVWHTIYEAGSGNPLMPGNGLHGMINTQGCWMLFRNFNWPQAFRPALEKVYLQTERPGRGRAAVIAGLVAAGYRVKAADPPAGFSSSYDKFLKYDRNWAYQWFTHEIVGVKYFADTDPWGSKAPVNDFNVHGSEPATTFPLSEAGKRPEYNLGDEGKLAYHDGEHPKMPIGPGLFRPNALGFQTASEFAPDLKIRLSPSALARCAWAEVYFYKEDDLDAHALTSRDVKR